MRRILNDQNRVLNSQLSFLMSSICKKQDIAKRIERLLPKIHGPKPMKLTIIRTYRFKCLDMADMWAS